MKKARAFKERITLRRLREVHPGFVPPQSFYCLDNEKFSKIKDFVKKNIQWKNSL